MSVPEGTDNGQAVADPETSPPAGKMRVTHRRNQAARFTIIATALFRDPEMPANALKIYGNIRGHAENFEFDANLVMRQTGIKRDGYQAAMRWLELKGLLTRYQVRLSNGQMGGWYIETSDEPMTSESCTSSPVPADPAPALNSNSSTSAAGTGQSGTGTDQQLSENTEAGPVPAEPVPAQPQLKKTTLQGDQVQEREEEEQQTPVVPDARRAVTQVMNALTGGYAAPEMTPAQRARYRKEVRSLFGAVLPAVFVGALPSNLPNELPNTFAAALEQRGVEVLKERVARRWSLRDRDSYAGTLTRPIPVAVWLVGHTRCAAAGCPSPYCPDPQCEDGVILDMDKPCPRCAEHRAQHRTAREALTMPAIPVTPAPDTTPPAPAAPPAAVPPARAEDDDRPPAEVRHIPAARSAPSDTDARTPAWETRREMMAGLRTETTAGGSNADTWRAAREERLKRRAA